MTDVDIIRNLLRNKELDGYDQCCSELASIGSNDAIVLLGELSREFDPELKCRALSLSVLLFPSFAVQLAAELLEDGDSSVRISGIHALQKLEATEFSQTIADLLLHDDDEEVRIWSAFALGEIGSVDQLDQLAIAIEIDDGVDYEGRSVKDVAMKSIERINTRNAGLP